MKVYIVHLIARRGISVCGGINGAQIASAINIDSCARISAHQSRCHKSPDSPRGLHGMRKREATRFFFFFFTPRPRDFADGELDDAEMGSGGKLF